MKRLLFLFLLPLSVFADGNVTTSGGHTTNGTVARGCRGLAFVCGTGATCAVNGVTIAAGAILEIPFQPQFKGDVIGAVPYTVSGGSLYSLEVR